MIFSEQSANVNDWLTSARARYSIAVVGDATEENLVPLHDVMHEANNIKREICELEILANRIDNVTESHDSTDSVEIFLSKMDEILSQAQICIRQRSAACSLLDRIRRIETWLKTATYDFSTFVNKNPSPKLIDRQCRALLTELGVKLAEVREIDDEQGQVDVQENDAIELHQLIQFVQLSLTDFRELLKSKMTRNLSISPPKQVELYVQ
uniref:Uncharacterized protein n=1 Tax=Romanomermis culicivorax TaxID=13658 RepID=A0A915IDJ7_ROMCU